MIATNGPLDLSLQPGRDLVPLAPTRAPVPVGEIVDSTPPRDPSIFDPRHATPREIAAYSLDIYAAGLITWDDQRALSIQPELHPDFDRTIGALLGQRAAPDTPRDFVREWERRLLFELRYNAENSNAVGQARRIVRALQRLGGVVTETTV